MPDTVFRDKLYKHLLAGAFILSLVLIGWYLALDHQSKFAQLLLAIAGSLLASALFSLWMIISDGLRDQMMQEQASSQSAVVEAVKSVESVLDRTAQKVDDIAGSFSRLGAEFLIARHPRERVESIITDSKMSGSLKISAVGLNLTQFYNDHLKNLKGVEAVSVRLLLPTPNSRALKAMCEREGRTLSVVSKNIENVTNRILLMNDPRFQVRWDDEVSAVTLVRVNDQIIWRPRFSEKVDTNEFFYCEFSASKQDVLFRIMENEFAQLWNDATQATIS